MSHGETPITFLGNITADPELRYTAQGTPVLNLRVASTPTRYNKKTGQREDQEPTFLTCYAWRHLAENAAATFTKGMRVIVYGTLHQRQWEAKDGTKRSTYEVTVTDLGPSLMFATAQIQRDQPTTHNHSPENTNGFSPTPY